MIPFIPKNEIITNDKILPNDNFQGLKIVDTQNDEVARNNYQKQLYQFQVDSSGHHLLTGTLSLKGAKNTYRIVFNANLTLQQFVDVIKYDPSSDNKPTDYDEGQMKEYHEKAQSDFKSSKKQNMHLFKDYIVEGLRGERTLNLPCICGWQNCKWFSDTFFVAFDASNPNSLYGNLYIPKRAVMQADGQTQTAALFRTYHSQEAQDNAHSTLLVTLEIELNVDLDKAGNSFADRNGRGTKKNLNLVRELDTSSAISQLRIKSVPNTIFDGRLANGRNSSTSITTTKDIVDNNTITLMLLEACSNGRLNDKELKHSHVKYLTPYAHNFLKYLEGLFGQYWLESTPAGQDPYRKIYVHGWPYVLKALGKLYYASKCDELDPILETIAAQKAHNSNKRAISGSIDYIHNPVYSDDENFKIHLDKIKALKVRTPIITPVELTKRLNAIDWHRYRKHWINITGCVLNADTNKKTFILKSTGETKVVAKSPNVYNIVTAVSNKILSDNWIDLCADIDEPLK